MGNLVKFCRFRVLNRQMQIFNHKHSEYFVQIFDCKHINGLTIIRYFMPHCRKWRRYQMENGHTSFHEWNVIVFDVRTDTAQLEVGIWHPRHDTTASVPLHKTHFGQPLFRIVQMSVPALGIFKETEKIWIRRSQQVE